MFAYFTTYATNAGVSALMAWRAEMLRVEPEARAIVIGLGMLRFRWDVEGGGCAALRDWVSARAGS